MAKAGRPSTYSSELTEEICRRLIEGESLRAICSADDMPSKSSVMKWLAENKDFSDQYARAREIQADIMVEEILEIADDGRNDWIERENADGSKSLALDHDHIQRSKLRVDTRKWLMSKMLPKKYGNKVDVEHGGGIAVTFAPEDDAI